ncbi:MAG: hypothetical protein MJ138_00325 [Kiritimatiellae bacterium]|nr:hypothetical protein [Kiritimatiellia bacterium]
MKKAFASFALLAFPLFAAEEDETDAPATFERYAIILERMPFGEPPPDFNPDAPPGAGTAKTGMSKEEAQAQAQLEQQQQQLVQQLRVTMLNVTPAGNVAVGFNAGEQHYYLLAGQEKDGWKVVGADLETNEATFEKDEIEVTVKLGGQASAASARAKTPVSAPEAAGAVPSADGGVSPVSRLRMRRQQRQAEMERNRLAAEEAAARAKKADDELKAKAAMEQERAEREKEERDAEMKAQRERLEKLAEELKRQREEAAAAKAKEASEEAGAEVSE